MNLKIALPTAGSERLGALRKTFRRAAREAGFEVIDERDLIEKMSLQSAKKLLNKKLGSSNKLVLLLNECLVDRKTKMIGVFDKDSGTVPHPKLLAHCEHKIFYLNEPSVREQLASIARSSHLVNDDLEYGKEQIKEGLWSVVCKDDYFDSDTITNLDTALNAMIEQESRRWFSEKNLSGMLDELDLRYQSFFRATMIDFSNYDDAVRQRQIRKILHEQSEIIVDRLKQCRLPIEDILCPKGFLASGHTRIVKDYDGQIMAIDASGNKKKVSFGRVDNEIANEFHMYLHYIHSPRAKESWGFFIEGDELPFSVLAIDNIDRQYKKACLLLYGYEPQRCLEYTRLYNWPHAPRNSSSALFAQVRKNITKNQPYMCAAISSFMPQYAKGTSMMTGGFKHPIISKPLQHHFIRTTRGYEHITKRRLDELKKTAKHICVTKKQRPVQELISCFQKPTMNAELIVGKHIIKI